MAKAWSTDVGFTAASLGVQILGGAAYIEEFGMAQRLRDARIGHIYEGTNRIQALDLVTRKLPRNGGRWVQDLFRSVASAIPRSISTDNSLATTYLVLTESLETLETTTKWMLDRMDTQPQNAVAGATSYLELFGMTIRWLVDGSTGSSSYLPQILRSQSNHRREQLLRCRGNGPILRLGSIHCCWRLQTEYSNWGRGALIH